jgi:hypothetical protein
MTQNTHLKSACVGLFALLALSLWLLQVQPAAAEDDKEKLSPVVLKLIEAITPPIMEKAMEKTAEMYDVVLEMYAARCEAKRMVALIICLREVDDGLPRDKAVERYYQAAIAAAEELETVLKKGGKGLFDREAMDALKADLAAVKRKQEELRPWMDEYNRRAR